MASAHMQFDPLLDSKIETKVRELEIKTNYIIKELSAVKAEIESVKTRTDRVNVTLTEKVDRVYRELSDKVWKTSEKIYKWIFCLLFMLQTAIVLAAFKLMH